MNHLIQFFVIGLIFTTISNVDSYYYPSDSSIKQSVLKYARDGKSIINSTDHVLKVSTDILYQQYNVVVCKGTYDLTPVAVKVTYRSSFDEEMEIYKVLNDTDPESHGVPKIYYHGRVFNDSYSAIAMSLFEGSLYDRYKNKTTDVTTPFSDFSVLVIFQQAVATLEYLNSKGVLHNDIKPQNMFLRKKKAFIGDFNVSTLNGTQSPYGTYYYRSSNFLAGLDRYPMDDLETLIFTLWVVANFEPDDMFGRDLMKQKKLKTAETWMKKINKQFKYEITQNVFNDICINEVLSERKVPRYGDIIKKLSDAIKRITRLTGQTQFEWLSKHVFSENFFKTLLSFV